jgi:hypothetical protein
MKCFTTSIFKNTIKKLCTRPRNHDLVEFTLKGQTLECLVKEIINCNTFIVTCSFHGVPIWVTCKFDGICGASKVGTDELQKYKECMSYLNTSVRDTKVSINFTGMDKFGKYIVLVKILPENKLLNDLLIDKNYAYSYQGGKKLLFHQWNLP